MSTSMRSLVVLLALCGALSATAQEEESTADQTQQTQQEPNEQQAQDGAEQAEPDSEQAAEAEAEDATPTASPPTEAATFVLQAHPLFPPEQAELVYRPLVDYLNEALPYRFDLSTSPDFHRYWLGIRRGNTPDLVLEEPHLTAYRMSEYGYTPLVKAVTPITYSLLTSGNNAESDLQDFVGQRISSMPAPSLGYLILTEWFDNPMQQPLIQSNANSWLNAVEIVFAMEADAAIVPYNLVERYRNMVNVRTSREFPGTTIAAGPSVGPDIRSEIRQALVVLHEDEDHFAALNELDVDRFVAAEPSDYEGLEEWLRLVYSVM